MLHWQGLHVNIDTVFTIEKKNEGISFRLCYQKKTYHIYQVYFVALSYTILLVHLLETTFLI